MLAFNAPDTSQVDTADRADKVDQEHLVPMRGWEVARHNGTEEYEAQNFEHGAQNLNQGGAQREEKQAGVAHNAKA